MEKQTAGFMTAQAARSRRLPTGRRIKTPEAHYELFRDWQRTQTQSSVTAIRRSRQQMDVRFCMGCRDHPPRCARAQNRLPIIATRALLSAPKELAFSLDRGLPWMSANPDKWPLAQLLRAGQGSH